MTALDEYARLESTGLWRQTPEDQRREVVLSFGEATLVIADTAGRPLTHWSLPAIQRLNSGTTPALFSPDPHATETLEIADDLMTEALETVRRALARQRPRRGRIRLLTALGVVAAVAFVGFLWLPGALTRQTLSVVPPAKRAEIGAVLLGHMQSITGPTCRDGLGAAALAGLQDRVLGADADGQILVVRTDLAAPVYLPGGLIVLPLAVIEGTDDPAVVAGHVLAAALSRATADPLEQALEGAGFAATFRLLTTGEIPPETLRDHAETLATNPTRLAAAETLGAGFEVARIPLSPWAYALDPSGETIDDLLAAEWWDGASTVPEILGDGSWISVKGICQ